jgi:F0F1-type ATP synthase membrane subunit c/vacuolar-type H+-ATPase subunit K
MPTDLDAAAAARKRDEQAQTQNFITVVLGWVIIFLGVLVLLLELGSSSS